MVATRREFHDQPVDSKQGLAPVEHLRRGIVHGVASGNLSRACSLTLRHSRVDSVEMRDGIPSNIEGK